MDKAFKIFGIPYILLLVVMLVATILFIAKSCSNSETVCDPDEPTPYNIQVVLADSGDTNPKSKKNDTTVYIPTQKIYAFIDSLGQIVKYNQEQIIDRQHEIVADIRQESNNISDRQSAWLGFWITVLGFVGVVCPIAYQYINTSSFKLQIKKSENKLAELRPRFIKFLRFRGGF